MPSSSTPRPPIHYRCGVYSTFLARMLGSVRTARVPVPGSADTEPLSDLNLELEHNFAVALLQGWALICDILSFYQETICNEGFIGTAEDDFSIVEMLGSVGYQLSQGTAATGYVSFEMADTAGPIAPATQLVSVPGPGETPQVFETANIAPVDASPDWNQVRVIPPAARGKGVFVVEGTRSKPIKLGYEIQGTTSGLSPGDLVLVLPQKGEPLPTLLDSGTLPTLMDVDVNEAAGLTRLVWQAPDAGTNTMAYGIESRVFQFGLKAAIFGYNAAAWSALPTAAQIQNGGTVLGGVQLQTAPGTPPVWGPANLGLTVPATGQLMIRAFANGPGNTLLAATGNGVVVIPWSGGSWQSTSSGLSLLNAYAMTTSTASGYVYAGTSGGGVFRSVDGAQTWERLAGAVLIVGSPPGNPTSWTTQVTNLPDTVVRALLAIPATSNGGTADGAGEWILAGTDNGLFLNQSDGRGWYPAPWPQTSPPSPLGAADVIWSLAISSQNVIYAATDAGIFSVSAALLPSAAWSLVNSSGSRSIVIMQVNNQDVLFSVSTENNLMAVYLPNPTAANVVGAPPTFAVLNGIVLGLAADNANGVLYVSTTRGVYSCDGTLQPEVVVGAPSDGPVIFAGPGGSLALSAPYNGIADQDWPGLTLSGSKIDLSALPAVPVEPGAMIVVSQIAPSPEISALVSATGVKPVNCNAYGLKTSTTRIEVSPALPPSLPPGPPSMPFNIRNTILYANAGQMPQHVEVSPNLPTTTVSDDAASIADLPGIAPDPRTGTPWKHPDALQSAVLAPVPPLKSTQLVHVYGFERKDESATVPVDPNGSPPPVESSPKRILWAKLSNTPVVSPPPPPRNVVTGVVKLQPAAEFTPLPGDLSKKLDMTTVQARGNVVPVSHGQSVAEIVGSGNSSVANQTFNLRKKPLLYTGDATVPAARPRSSLTVTVNGVAWAEMANFLASGPSSTHFTVRVDSSQRAQLTFGDGVHGARLPTGTDNVRARYRIGEMAAGSVGSGSITQLRQRPLGVRTVVNLDKMTPGQPAEKPSSARGQSPLQLRCLDRVVSLDDYATFALLFPGITSAVARLHSHRGRTLVLLTAACPAADRKDIDATLLALAVAITAVQVAPVPLAALPPVTVLGSLRAEVLCTAGSDSTAVSDLVLKAVNDALAPSARSVGAGLAAIQFERIVHSLPGVAGVRLMLFRRPGATDADIVPLLVARPARLNDEYPEGIGADVVGLALSVASRSVASSVAVPASFVLESADQRISQ